MTKIGIQGAQGSFSEEAANIFIKNHGLKNVKIEYLITSENVIDSIEKNKIDYGIFAMENAQGGVVIESVEALSRHRCDIAEMFYVEISQCLLAHHGVNLGDITEIHSHQQALRQCREYLSENFWTRPLIEEDDTAESARRLQAGKLPMSAAVVAPKTCAELYGLAILKEGIHDLKNNLTLFIGVKKWKNDEE